jgi:hypothetical protein
LVCLTPLSTLFQLYHVCHFHWRRNPMENRRPDVRNIDYLFHKNGGGGVCVEGVINVNWIHCTMVANRTRNIRVERHKCTYWIGRYVNPQIAGPAPPHLCPHLRHCTAPNRNKQDSLFLFSMYIYMNIDIFNGCNA